MMAWRLIGAGLLGALAESTGVALMATATWLLMTAAGQPPLPALTVAIVSVRALAIGRGGLRYLERLASHDTVLRIVTDPRARIFARLIDRPLARHADALSRVVSDVDAVQDLVVRVALPTFAGLLVMTLAIVGAVLIDPLAGLTLGAGLVVSALVLPVLGYRLVRRGADRLAPLRAAYAIATIDIVHGAADLAAYGACGRYEEVAAGYAQELSDMERRLARRSYTLDLMSGTAGGLTAAAVLLVAAQRGVTPVWAAVAAIGALATGELALTVLAAARRFAEISGSLARVRELTSPPATQARDGGWETGTPVRLEGVGVDGRLTGIDLDLSPGRKIAVVGPSGAGKSTLLAVIAGAIRPDQGRVVRIRDGVATGLMADAHLFHTTIGENLRLAAPQAGDEELIKAGAVAGIELSHRYPLEVLVGEDGAQLSGGERQRLALARAVLADSDVLLLDEPTEGLDPALADTVLRQVLDHADDRTVVLVTHRLTSLDSLGLDEILVLDEGQIIERGVPARLLTQEGWMRAHLL